MPGFDGTGPGGQGAMTGRGFGYCAGYAVPGACVPYGRGLGRARGFGRGLRRRVRPVFYEADYAGPYADVMSPRQEADMLRQEAGALKDELEILHERIRQLEKREKEG